MRGAEQGDVQPQVLAVARGDALATADVGFHAPRHHVARGEFLLLRLVVRHEAVAVHVAQQAAVAPATLGDQDAGREDGGGVELHRLHVAERHDAGFQRDGGADAFVDHRVGGRLVDAPEAAGGDAGGAGDIGQQAAVDQVADDGAVAAPAVVDQRHRFHALMHRDAGGDGLVADGVEHGVAGAVRDVAGAPFLGAAEIAGGDQAVRCGAFGQRYPLAVHHHVVRPLLHAVPRHAPGGQFAHRLRCGMHEHAGDFLVVAPVAAAYGVLEMHILVVASCRVPHCPGWPACRPARRRSVSAWAAPG